MHAIAVSILNHDASKPTLECIASLEREMRASGGAFELRVRVLDNGSKADDVAILQDKLAVYDWVHLEVSPVNSGFAAGHNRNLRALLERGSPDFVWLLNNDCIVQAGCVEGLLACAGSRPNTAVWGATLLERDAQTVQCAGGCSYSPWLSSYRQHGRGTKLADLARLKPGKFDYIAGASLFMPVATLLGGLAPPARHPADGRGPEEAWLNEAFFLYFEELDLARRLQPGRHMDWCREALVVHGHAEKSRERERRSEFHSSLSALKFTWLYHRNHLWLTAPARLSLKTAWNLVCLRWDLLPPLFSAYREFGAWRRRA